MYQHIFFDLDHTLWDFDSNARETLLELFEKYELSKFDLFSSDEFIDVYTINNHALWKEYHLGKISKEQLRETRFKKTFHHFGLDDAKIPIAFEDDYVNICPTKTNLFPGTHDVLSKLANKYVLHIITNGFYESSELKLTKTSLKPYFHSIFVSEVIGLYKPDIALFNHALEVVSCNPENAIMIGDSLEADILGARNAGIDQVFFNPNKLEHMEDVTFEINHLTELLNIL